MMKFIFSKNLLVLVFTTVVAGSMVMPVFADGARCCKVSGSNYVYTFGIGGGNRVGEAPTAPSCFQVSDTQPCAPATEEKCIPLSVQSDNLTCTSIVRTPIYCTEDANLCHYGTAAEDVDCGKVMNSSDDIAKQKLDCLSAGSCFYAGGKCLNKYRIDDCKILPKTLCGTNEGAKPTVCQWSSDSNVCLPALEATLSSQYGTEKAGGILSTCALQGTCRNVNDILIAAIRIIRSVFALIGSLAFAAFVYGGLLMIVSFGNADRVEQGKGAMVAAVVGMAIAFSAYVLVGYILTVFNTGASFRLL